MTTRILGIPKRSILAVCQKSFPYNKTVNSNRVLPARRLSFSGVVSLASTSSMSNPIFSLMMRLGVFKVFVENRRAVIRDHPTPGIYNSRTFPGFPGGPAATRGCTKWDAAKYVEQNFILASSVDRVNSLGFFKVEEDVKSKCSIITSGSINLLHHIYRELIDYIFHLLPGACRISVNDCQRSAAHWF